MPISTRGGTRRPGTCERGGAFVVDIRNPRKPKEVDFIDAMVGTYPGEGNQVIRVRTPFFRGDLLTINSEACAGSGTPATRRGGITLVDVTNPRRPVKLSENFDDITPPSVSAAKLNPEHLTQSTFSWQDGDHAYTVMVDSEELTVDPPILSPWKTKSSRWPAASTTRPISGTLQYERAAVGRPLVGLLPAGQGFVSRRLGRPSGRRARTPASAGSSGRA